MRGILAPIAAIVLVGCAQHSATPLGNHMMQIDVSASPAHGRAGAQSLAFTKAAEATLAAGYDKFVVVNSEAWNEQTEHAQSSGSVVGNSSSAVTGSAAGVSGKSKSSVRASSSSSYETVRRPEAKMIIRMFKQGEPGSETAIDARATLKAQS